jgi:D-sedoheptulose 7-phosphate isomerase
VIETRSIANAEFFDTEAARISELSRELAERFLAGGRLLAIGLTPQDLSDAHHVAVEFVHPVIVGKRALPALALRPDELERLATPVDAVIAFGMPARAPDGCLTIGFAPGAATWVFDPPTTEPLIRQELVETLYHVLWETVHVYLEHLGSSGSGAGASGFLYPFLERDAESSLGRVRDDVAASVRAKAREVGALREQTIGDGSHIAAVADVIGERLAAGAKVLALGNGGSATDAADLVADLHALGWPAVDLTADSAILTALANDIGPAVLFQRQVIAHGLPGDVAVAFSTSGGSPNVLEALAEARRRGLVTVAIVGYGGGQITGRLADHVISVDSDYVPRIQEAQATVYHMLCELVPVGPEWARQIRPGTTASNASLLEPSPSPVSTRRLVQRS